MTSKNKIFEGNPYEYVRILISKRTHARSNQNFYRVSFKLVHTLRIPHIQRYSIHTSIKLCAWVVGRIAFIKIRKCWNDRALSSNYYSRDCDCRCSNAAGNFHLIRTTNKRYRYYFYLPMYSFLFILSSCLCIYIYMALRRKYDGSHRLARS